MKRSKFVRMSVLLLALVMMLQLAPVTGVQSVVPAVASTGQTDGISADEETVRTRVQELVGLRETNSETYLMSDGTYECVVYAEDKYYEDESGDLQTISNAIIPDTTARAEGRYKNSGNAFDVYFSSGGTPTVSMQYQGCSVSFSPVTASQNQVMSEQAVTAAMSVGQVNNCSTLTDLTPTGDNTVTYANAFGNADLIYVLTNHALKEYIVLESSTDLGTYSFAVTLDGLTVQESGGTVVLADAGGNPVFTFGSLFAVDAVGVMTDAVTYTVAAGGSASRFVLTVSLDEQYLSDPQRVFPVVIDPTLMISSVQTADTYVSSANPNTNYYLEGYLRTGCDSPYGVRRSYIRFDIPEGIPFYEITGVYLDVVMVSGVAPAVKAYRCAGSWTSSTLTWNNKPGYDSGMASAAAAPRSSGSAWYRMDVTEIVEYCKITGTDYGFVLRDDNESDASHWTTFCSSDALSPNKPELHIIYSGPTVCVNFLYDAAYLTRYPAAQSRILSHAQTLQSLYLQKFGINIIINSPLCFTSYADQCTSDPNSYCAHAADSACANSNLIYGNLQTYHHTNLYNIMARVPYPDNSTTVTVVYTGHVTCICNFGICQKDAVRGYCEPTIGMCLLGDFTSDTRELQTMVHEFGHLYGIIDHYGNGGLATENMYDETGIMNFSENCIYGENRDNADIMGSFTICDGCAALIELNRDNYDQTNN